ncbi:putative beta-lysine N-acetyltransferase [Bacillus sonorensis]|uniref:Beta-lysine N-acetyltransferase YodP n=2 Tax=Bacillus sonorensis TaxID=119858 RepID=M5PA72_9BACI|nr:MULTISPECIES: putative beta-lysine N-acetyltransferase [Bacillus]TWK82443.1 N-acetyltransferase YodP [Bacillus paralicheniformis]ASB88817.1 Lysine 2,3-aminomutase [Bacillus sonorensis]EME76373.1 beta-lysine N-acetyltransferase YodP [Bacillus sonorensis L12]MBG9915385.1 acetyltransferase [Bacillus sonorensis]MCY8089511.1 putative beta-lysine N-acetyltransferase [Bacillus sonorensis]
MIKTWENECCRLELDLDVFNKRIRIINYEGNVCSFFRDIMEMAKANDIEKIIIFAKTNDIAGLLEHVFEPEGQIDGYYNGHDAAVLVNYLKESRRRTDEWIVQDDMLRKLFGSPIPQEKKLSPFLIRPAAPGDAPLLAKLYQEVFPVYPAPVSDPVYVNKTMEEGAVYYLAFDQEKLVAAAGADVNYLLGHAEVTDCAVLPSYRGHSLTKRLISALETELRQAGIFHVFSIARAASMGMNATLYHLSYRYRGRLINNCVIYKSIENMNIWCKNLSRLSE